MTCPRYKYMSGLGPERRFSESLKLVRVVVVLWEGKRLK